MRIGLTRYKNRGFNCERFARIDSRDLRCESPVPLSTPQEPEPPFGNHHKQTLGPQTKHCGDVRGAAGLSLHVRPPSRASPPCPRDLTSSAPICADLCQDKFDHDKGQKSAISGRRLHWRLSRWIFCFFSSIYAQFSKTSP